MICADHRNKEIVVAAPGSLNTVKQSGMDWRIAMETTRKLEEGNITDDLIAFVQQNSSKICRKMCWGTLKCLRGVAKHCSQALDNKGRPYVWQQDSAPCYTSGKRQKWLSANFYDYTSPNVWPLNSPDLNPMDYYVCGVVEKDTNRRENPI